MLVAQQARFGNRWATIARDLPGRCENDVKNRWYSSARRKAGVTAAAATHVRTSMGASSGGAADHQQAGSVDGMSTRGSAARSRRRSSTGTGSTRAGTRRATRRARSPPPPPEPTKGPVGDLSLVDTVTLPDARAIARGERASEAQAVEALRFLFGAHWVPRSTGLVMTRLQVRCPARCIRRLIAWRYLTRSWRGAAGHRLLRCAERHHGPRRARRSSRRRGKERYTRGHAVASSWRTGRRSDCAGCRRDGCRGHSASAGRSERRRGRWPGAAWQR